MKTNCSATTVIADWMISLYSNYCVAVQISNEFLHQTADRLFKTLSVKHPPVHIIEDGDDKPVLEVDEHKEWCIIQ